MADSAPDQSNDFNARTTDEFRANEGRVGDPFAGTMILIHHIGAKSGIERVTPLASTPRGDGRYAIVASRRIASPPRLVLQAEGEPPESGSRWAPRPSMCSRRSWKALPATGCGDGSSRPPTWFRQDQRFLLEDGAHTTIDVPENLSANALDINNCGDIRGACGCRANRSWISARLERRVHMTRRGRRTSSPPQLGHAALSSSAQVLQNVHS
jgi:F420H(2)-dependent quinone reductase